jgi:hypothetical protein
VPLTVFPPDGALEFVTMDVLAPLPTSSNGHKYILFISDRFTKLTVAIPIADKTASTVAQAFVDRWMLYFGMPIVLLTDNGRNFSSKFMVLIYERENKLCFSLELSHIQFINNSLHIVDLFHISCHDISIIITSFVTRTNTHLLQYYVSCLVVDYCMCLQTLGSILTFVSIIRHL